MHLEGCNTGIWIGGAAQRSIELNLAVYLGNLVPHLHVLHGAVIPEILRHLIFCPVQLALHGAIGDAGPLVYDINGLSVLGLLACLGPVPEHDSGVFSGKEWNMTGLTSHLVRVVVHLLILFVRPIRMAGLTGYAIGRVLWHGGLVVVGSRIRIVPALNVVHLRGVTALTVIIQACLVHVHIQGFGRSEQG